MRVSRDQAAENRARIIEVASQQFRQKGFDGIGVADVMKNPGLTHGGFYGHFASKDDLIAQSCDAAMKRSAEKWSAIAQEGPEVALPRSRRPILPRITRVTWQTAVPWRCLRRILPGKEEQSRPDLPRAPKGCWKYCRIWFLAGPKQKNARKPWPRWPVSLVRLSCRGRWMTRNLPTRFSMRARLSLALANLQTKSELTPRTSCLARTSFFTIVSVLI